MHKKKMQ